MDKLYDAINKDQIDICKHIIKVIKPDINDYFNNTLPLHLAIKNNNVPIVKLLLKYNADVTKPAKDKSGNRAVHIAAINNFSAIK